MAQVELRTRQWPGWDEFARHHISVLKLFWLYVVPLSVLPPAMIYYAGITYGGGLLPELSVMQLRGIGIVFFVTQLAMTFVLAWLVQRLSEWVEIEAAFEDAYKLVVVVPMPLWFAPLFLFIPSFAVNLAAGAAALILSARLIFSSVQPILKIEEKGRAILLSGAILSAAMVAWAAMMYLTLLYWSFNTHF